MAEPKSRNVRIEMLRLAAILAIAVFHTFQPLFASATGWASLADAAARDAAALASDAAAALSCSPVALGTLGFINLFGAFGNCAFFMISGFFLIPRCARASRTAGYGRAQAAKTARKAAVILVSVGIYAALALLAGTAGVVLPGVSLHEAGWLLGGLEFIWVYLAVIAAAPLIGWIWERCRARAAVVALIIAAVYLVNAYIAFVSPGEAERGLLEWRKLMSAVSYLAAFLAGGLISRARPSSGRRRMAVLAACLSAAWILECALAATGQIQILVATSFKSTSIISFALAALALHTCALPPAAPAGTRTALVAKAASSILGFYILQSVFYALWRPAVDAVLGAVAASCQGAALAWATFVAGAFASALVVAACLAVDRLVRMPVLRLLHLA